MHEAIFSALPSAKNNPDQEELYEAFANRDVETVLRTDRKERKQLFVTSMSLYYAGDLAKASFYSTAMMRRGDRMRTTEMEGYEGFDDEMYMMEEYEMMRGAGMMESPYALQFGPGAQAAQIEKKSGFVVTIEGYSPYKSIGELLEPMVVGKEPDEWGFVTRLAHLDDIVDGNSLFELYEKTDPNHFRLTTGKVGLDEAMPKGIGVLDVRYEEPGAMMSMGAGKQFLIDPMTKEEIGKVAELDNFGQVKVDRDNNPVYATNDQWFILNVKFVWKDAPKPPETPGMGMMQGSSYRMSPRPAPSSGAAPSRGAAPSGGRRAPGLPMEF